MERIFSQETHQRPECLSIQVIMGRSLIANHALHFVRTLREFFPHSPAHAGFVCPKAHKAMLANDKLPPSKRVGRVSGVANTEASAWE